jgi:hypothetical protein
MVTMIDEMFDRAYRTGRADLNGGIHTAFGGLAREIGKGLAAMHRFEWSAPWNTQPGRRTHG